MIETSLFIATLRKGLRAFLPTLCACVLFLSCQKSNHEEPHGIKVTGNAELLAIYERDGFDEVFIVNPHGEEMAHYVLINKGDTITSQLPENAIKIMVPVQSLVIDSEVYAGALEELKSAETIKGLFDAAYATSPSLQNRIKEGTIKNLGISSSPNSESILKIAPDAIILSYYDGMQSAGIEKLGIPVIKMYDLQEPSPLGRAEWIKFLGRLTGKGEEADSIFQEVYTNYNNIKNSVSSSTSPKVLTEIMYEGIWNTAGGNSYQANLIQDAGGSYFKQDDKSNVTLRLSPEQVLSAGGDADIWLIRYFGNEEQLVSILNGDPVYGEIKAFKNGNVFFSDTSSSALFREFPFHPDRLLEDYMKIFKGENMDNARYFKRLNTTTPK